MVPLLYYPQDRPMRLVSLAALLAPAVLGQDFRGQIKLKPLVPPITQPWK